MKEYMECPEGMREFIAQTDLETLIYWKLSPRPAQYRWKELVALLERPLFKVLLRYTRSNQCEMAYILDINRNTIRKRLAAHNIDGLDERVRMKRKRYNDI